MKTLLKIFFTILIYCFPFINYQSSIINCNAQNLVPNPSFEDTIYCPYVGEMNAVKEWYSYSASPDFYHTCAEFDFGVPNNAFGYQQPVLNGTAYCGIYTYNNYLWPPNPDTN